MRPNTPDEANRVLDACQVWQENNIERFGARKHIGPGRRIRHNRPCATILDKPSDGKDNLRVGLNSPPSRPGVYKVRFKQDTIAPAYEFFHPAEEGKLPLYGARHPARLIIVAARQDNTRAWRRRRQSDIL